MNTTTLLIVAQRIAAEISMVIQKSVGLGEYTGAVGAGGDRTKKGDQIVEDALRQTVPVTLQEYGIQHCVIVSEETGRWSLGDPEQAETIFMIIDPIDGSNNMRPHHTPRPFLGFSIALGTLKQLREKGTFAAVEVGVVRDVFHGEEYYATRGGGAYLGGSKLNTSQVAEMEETVIGTSLDRVGEKMEALFESGLHDLLVATKCQRRIGSTALDLCMVASGDYDAYVTLGGGAKVHDIAAAQLVIEEAGGLVELFYRGKPANDGKHLLDLFEKGAEGVRDISFQIIASGNRGLATKIEKIVRLG